MKISAEAHFTPSLETAAPTTKSDYVSRVLLDAIITGQFEAGQHMAQQEIANSLGLSPTPVREALRKLEAMGVLTYQPHRGVRVPLRDPATADEVYAARSVLEGLVVQEAVPRFQPSQLARLHELSSELMPRLIRQSKKSGDFRAYRNANLEFHNTFCQVSGMGMVQEIIRGLWARTALPNDFFIVLLARAPNALDEHLSILEAVEAGKPARARRMMELHVDHARQAYRDYLDSAAVKVAGRPPAARTASLRRSRAG
ncbi:MAG: GntR family transcriptional regulator [Anaerolineales bacterium]|nr:GntR family transcriptional regulator [Anaerolineales bacterium]